MHIHCSKAIEHLYISHARIRLYRLGTFFLLLFFFFPIGAEGQVCLISISCYHSNNFFNPTVTLGFPLSQDTASRFYPLAPIVHDVHRRWVSSCSLHTPSAHEDSKGCRRRDSPTLPTTDSLPSCHLHLQPDSKPVHSQRSLFIDFCGLWIKPL